MPERSHQGGRRVVPTRDGILVRSGPEARIADWLSRHAISYEYEGQVAGMRPDFVLRQRRTVVEYWGGAGFGRYAERMAKKTAKYEAEGWRVVHVVPVNLWELEQVLAAALLQPGPP